MSVHFLHRGGRRYTLGEEAFSSSFAPMPVAALQPATSNLQMWLRTDSLTSSNGSVVNAWLDVNTGNPFSASLGTVTNTFLTNQLNTYGAIGFGSGGNMKVSTPLFSNFTASQGCTLFMVCKVQNTAAQPYYHNIGGDTPSSCNNNFEISSNNIRSVFGTTDTSGSSAGNTFAYNKNAVTASHIMEERAKNGLYEFLINSSSVAKCTVGITGSMITPTNGSGNAWALFSGCRGTGANLSALGCSGSLFEVLFYNAVISDADRQTTYTYLKSKYNL